MAQPQPTGGMVWNADTQQWVPTYYPPDPHAGVQLSMPVSSAPTRPGPGSAGPLLGELGQMDQQGRELFNTVAQNPFAQIATNYGKTMLQNTKISSFFSLEPLKYYFNVNNSYVLNKLKLLLCPYLHKSWKRQVIRKDEMEFFCPPRDDVNAPDLYIPLMAFVTYVILVGFLMGTTGQFTPDVLGSQSSKGIVTILLEVLYVRAGLYFFENATEVNLLDIVAYCSYIFVLIILNVLVGYLFGSLAYYVTLVVTGLFMATFIVRTLVRIVVLPDQSGVAKRSERNGLLMSIAAMQFLLAWFLGVVV